MSTLHVIGIDRELLMKWKSCAYGAGMNFRDWVMEALNLKAGEPSVYVPVRVKRAYQKREKPAEVHNPRQCRVYECPACRQAGYHDPIRGV